MKKFLKRILGIVIVLFILFSIAYILTLPFSILVSALKRFLGNNYHGVSSFWEINFFFSFFTLIIICFLLDKYEANIDKFLRNRFLDNKTNKEEYETMNTPKIDKEQIEKQFCYDSSNPCPYCDTKFKHTALHCAVYFSDMERLKEVIDLIKKADEVDDYKNSKLHKTLYGDILDETDFRKHDVILSAILMKNTDAIKLLFNTTGCSGFEVYNGEYTIDTIECTSYLNHWIPINLDDDKSIKLLIDLYQYKKKTQTGKYILDKHQEQQDLIKNEHEKRLRGK